MKEKKNEEKNCCKSHKYWRKKWDKIVKIFHQKIVEKKLRIFFIETKNWIVGKNKETKKNIKHNWRKKSQKKNKIKWWKKLQKKIF